MNEIRKLVSRLHDIYRDLEPYDPTDAIVEISKILFLKLVDERFSWGRFNMNYIRRELLMHKGKSLMDVFNELLKDATAEYGLPNLTFSVRNEQTLIKMVETLQGVELGDDLDVLGEAYEEILQVLFRGQLGQFFTPRPVVEFMVEVANIKPGESIIDPFAGSCGMLIYTLKRSKDLKVLGIEKSPRICFVGRINLLLHGGDPKCLIEADSFIYNNGRIAGKAELGAWNVVVTNPPFGSRIRDDTILSTFRRREIDYTEAEALALRVMLDLATEGGRIVTVVPENLMKNPTFSKLRSIIKREAVIRAYISLPLSTFSGYGSTIKTGILYLVKRGRGVREGKVLFACARYAGVDRAGNHIAKNDLPAILQEIKKLRRMWGDEV